jgi:hypothetical protein
MSAAVVEFDREGHCHLRVSLHVSLLALEVLRANWHFYPGKVSVKAIERAFTFFTHFFRILSKYPIQEALFVCSGQTRGLLKVILREGKIKRG